MSVKTLKEYWEEYCMETFSNVLCCPHMTAKALNFLYQKMKPVPCAECEHFNHSEGFCNEHGWNIRVNFMQSCLDAKRK